MQIVSANGSSGATAVPSVAKKWSEHSIKVGLLIFLLLTIQIQI